ncbi:hypothetical protein CJF42_06040 [Pseudoalteromonas sp. NBT06-2]|uniref:MFS transporter n=1 Tax=Pseudoalteromonas sp. NBT06-2 TaxID=2025950 RepID=UPI000BA6FF8F|nr:MFS transporter [Pseudoalteromonas sp. NBT06-2]PAJ75208.1 hypothetical protein CJF42_06040 [Pseudoalteromonas sp. NBT06-2]
MQKIKQILSLQIIMTLSMGLLLFIGVGESYRVMPSLLLTDACNQAQLLKNSIETNLKLGIPVEFKGFNQLADNLAEQSDQIANAQIIILHDQQAQHHDALILTCNMTDKDLQRVLTIDWQGLLIESDFDDHYQITLGLADKIGQVAQLVITPEHGFFKQAINAQFRSVIILSLVLCVLFPFIICFNQHLKIKYAKLMQQGLYHLALLLVGCLIINSLINLYTAGIKAQSNSLARSLEARLSIPLTLGFDLDSDLSGFDELLLEYRLKNPDISHIYLLNNSKISSSSVTESHQNEYKSKESLVCSSLSSEAQHSQYISICLDLVGSTYQIVIKTPWSRVLTKLWRAARNILVLLIAAVLLLSLFFDVLVSIQNTRNRSNNCNTSKGDIKDRLVKEKVDNAELLTLIRPVFALGVLMEAINLSFLPAYLSSRFVDADFSVSSVFAVYFICFAIILIPAGRCAENYSLRNMMLTGLILSVIGIGGIAFIYDPLSIIVLRGLSGFGQGILLIAVQSYLLRLQNLQATEQLVIGFNMSTISGVTIGALLMPMLGESSVFLIGATIGTINCIYCFMMITDLDPVHKTGALIQRDVSNQVKMPKRYKFIKLFSDLDLYKSVILIGFPTKAVYVGVLMFMIPLLLKAFGFDIDTIGQILVFYYFGVLISTIMISKFGGFLNYVSLMLFLGCLGSGLGLIMLGMLGQLATHQEMLVGKSFKLTAVILVSVLLIGIAHGLIHAPIVTHVVRSKSALLVGQATTAATYRFLERLGCIAGPVLASLILVNHDGTMNIELLVLVGFSIIVCGIIFIWPNISFNKKLKK